MQDWALQSALFEMADVLCFSFDLELHEARPVPDWFRVEGVQATAFARDATGGVYAITQRGPLSSGYGIHADPSGRAAVLGRSLGEVVGVVIALPYWRDVLTLSAGGNLERMRLAACELEAAALDDIPALADARDELFRVLPLATPTDPVELLHQLNVEAPPTLSIVGDDGWQYRSLVC
jgi:hypothetical protein